MSTIDIPDSAPDKDGNRSWRLVRGQRFSAAETTVLAFTVLCALLQLWLQFVQQINWDEFYYLSQIYEYQRGTLTRPLQTLHVHLFGWLANTFSNEVIEVRAARVVMWVLEMGTLGLIYWIARGFFSRFASALAVFAYISAGFVLLHGTSFRTDPIAVFLVMTALALIIRSPLRTAELLVVSLTLSIAFLVTVKVAFFAPALAGAGLWRVSASHRPLKLLAKLTATALGALLIAAILYQLHSNAIGGATLSATRSTMHGAYQSTLLSAGLFPTGAFVLNGVIAAPIQTLLFCCGFVAAVAALFQKNRDRRNVVLFLLLASPLASLLVYRNAYPYFMAFIFPPAMVLVALAIDRVKFTPLVKMALAPLMMATFAHTLVKRLPYGQDDQSRVLETVHRMFPQGVSYIDRKFHGREISEARLLHVELGDAQLPRKRQAAVSRPAALGRGAAGHRQRAGAGCGAQS